MLLPNDQGPEPQESPQRPMQMLVPLSRPTALAVYPEGRKGNTGRPREGHSKPGYHCGPITAALHSLLMCAWKGGFMWVDHREQEQSVRC